MVIDNDAICGDKDVHLWLTVNHYCFRNIKTELLQHTKQKIIQTNRVNVDKIQHKSGTISPNSQIYVWRCASAFVHGLQYIFTTNDTHDALYCIRLGFFGLWFCHRLRRCYSRCTIFSNKQTLHFIQFEYISEIIPRRAWMSFISKIEVWSNTSVYIGCITTDWQDDKMKWERVSEKNHHRLESERQPTHIPIHCVEHICIFDILLCNGGVCVMMTKTKKAGLLTGRKREREKKRQTNERRRRREQKSIRII